MVAAFLELGPLAHRVSPPSSANAMDLSAAGRPESSLNLALRVS
jgi:hypothetical protein